jgi:DNA-binding SARP family transcriptional activator/tetratricopeptide (TPR) repeat protein
VRFSVLGPVEVVTDAGPVQVGRPRHRGLLAYLLLQGNRVVGQHQVIEALWGGAEPASAPAQVHVAMSALRRALREHGLPDVISTEPGGYLLRLGPDDLDADLVTHDIAAARAAAGIGDWTESARRLRTALDRWRGPALSGITAAFAAAARQRLEDQRVGARELLAEAELALGHHETIIPELLALVSEHPDRERLAGQLMLAQYRSGQRAEALATARRLRLRLVEAHGLDPSDQFVRLEKGILDGDPALAAPPAQPSTQRRIPPARPAASARTPAAPPAQLPLDTSWFTGRARELAALSVPDGGGLPVDLIAGMPGVGKTALAVHWAHRHLADYPDGQLYVDLRGFDPVRPPLPALDVLHRFLRALGADPADLPDDLDEAAAAFRSHVAGRRVLVVLDNAADADQVRPLLPGAPTCRVLVTSRRELPGLVAGAGARPLPLEPLPPDEAHSLLRGVLAGAPGDVAELARGCAYLPLALRLAAAQLRCRPGLSVAEYVRGLTDPLAVLDSGDGVVSAAFHLSYRAASPAGRHLFRLLGAVPGRDFTTAVAAALLGVGESAAAEPLVELRTGHLVTEHRPGRYLLHDLLRSYANRSLDDAGPDAAAEAARRLVDLYLDAVYEACLLLQPRRPAGDRDIVHRPVAPLRFPDRAAALAWHDAERDNLLAVIGLAAAHGWHRGAWQLTNDLFAYFIIRRRWTEWTAALDLGERSAAACADHNAQAHMANARGVLNKQTGRYAVARAHYERAVELAAAAGNRLSAAAFRANLAGLCVNQGDPATAVLHLRAALAAPEYGANPRYAPAALVNLGCALIELGRHPEARASLERALELATRHDDLQQVCHAHHNLGEIALAERDFDTAREHAERELARADQLGDPLVRAAALDALASALLPGDPAAARVRWAAALALYEGLGHQLAPPLAGWLHDLDTGGPAFDAVEADAHRRRAARRMF